MDATLLDWQLRFAMPFGPWAALPIVLGLFVFVYLGCRDLRSLRPPRRRHLLVALRILSGLVLALFAVQPSIDGRRVEILPGAMAVVIDSSRSMAIVDGSGSRAAAAEATLSALAEAEIADESGIYSVGDALRPGFEVGDGFRPRDEESGIAAGLVELFRTTTADDLGAVVLISDGADRHRALPSDGTAGGVRVHTVAVGSDDLRDDGISAIAADGVAYLRRTAEVRVSLRRIGEGSDPLPLELWHGDRLVRQTIVELGATGEAEVVLRFVPNALGRTVYRLAVPVAADDMVPENNERSFLVDVVRDKLRVLLVAGTPSWDERFLRAFLKADPSIDLISFFILRTTTDLTMSNPEELALIPFPTDELFSEHLPSFDLVIFQDFDFEPYQMAQYLPRIRDYVMRGGAFAMLGGDKSFSLGGYAGTPIAEILPVDLPSATSSEQAKVRIGRFRPEVVWETRHHPLLALLPRAQDSVARWQSLSPLGGVNVLSAPKEHAQVLLRHPDQRGPGGAPLPVLVVGQPGEGRSLALASDESFRWGITTAGATGDGSAYPRFWDAALRWLTKDPTLEPALVTTDRQRYGPAATMTIRAHLRDAAYQPLEGHGVVLRIEGFAGAVVGEQGLRTDGDGRVQTTMPAPRTVGAYRAIVVDAADGAAPGPASAPVATSAVALASEVFVVEAGGDELADPRVDHGFLRELSAATGGRHFSAPPTAAMLRQLETTRVRWLGREQWLPLASPPAILVLLGVLLGEWFVRRRFGAR